MNCVCNDASATVDSAGRANGYIYIYRPIFVRSIGRFTCSGNSLVLGRLSGKHILSRPTSLEKYSSWVSNERYSSVSFVSEFRTKVRLTRISIHESVPNATVRQRSPRTAVMVASDKVTAEQHMIMPGKLARNSWKIEFAGSRTSCLSPPTGFRHRDSQHILECLLIIFHFVLLYLTGYTNRIQILPLTVL